MVIKEVLLLGNPKLRKNSRDVVNFNNELRNDLNDLRDTLTHLQKTKKLGRAIAAPQINLLKNIIYFHLPEKSFYIINPKISWRSKEMFYVWDSCFCFDVAFFIEILRHRKIKVEYQNEEGNVVLADFSDDLSELVQHEIDHLHGILATDHIKNVKKIIMRDEWEKRFK
ncbi:MAG: peptide deformylase [Promethearchaeota archaeon]|jgi:peptide deformylase